MDLKTLFARRLDDLHLAINSEDEYEILKISRIIRQLCLDGPSSLVDQINREHRLKLAFKVIEPTQGIPADFPPPDVWFATDSIDPRRMPPGTKSVLKTRDAFFGMKIGYVSGTAYTVGETVKFVANVLGEVHAGSPADHKERVLDEVGKIYIFSNVSVLLQHMRAIGGIVLETLKILRHRVLNLGRFDDSPGISIHMVLALYPGDTEKELYILDIGTELDRNRLSVYLDSRQELTFRLIGATGKRKMVRAGAEDCAYRRGDPGYFVFEIGILADEVLLSIEAGGWSFSTTIPACDFGFDPGSLWYVIGSDVVGQAETHMSLMEQLVYSRCLKTDERTQLQGYFENRIRQGYEQSVYFKGHQFLHSTEHPNFQAGKMQEINAGIISRKENAKCKQVLPQERKLPVQLRKAFDAVSALPPERQDALAKMILAEIQDDKLWDEAFARSQDKLAVMADEALAEHRAGKTRSMEDVL